MHIQQIAIFNEVEYCTISRKFRIHHILHLYIYTTRRFVWGYRHEILLGSHTRSHYLQHTQYKLTKYKQIFIYNSLYNNFIQYSSNYIFIRTVCSYSNSAQFKSANLHTPWPYMVPILSHIISHYMQSRNIFLQK